MLLNKKNIILLCIFLFSFSKVSASPFGGQITQLIDCDCNNSTWITVSDPVGGDFIKTPQTTAHACEPMMQGEWILGEYSGNAVCKKRIYNICVTIKEAPKIDFYGTSPNDCIPSSSSGSTSSIIHRFYSPTKRAHFFTISEEEKNNVLNKYKNIWNYEGESYFAYKSDDLSGLVPVYRFYSEKSGSHFYTASKEEAVNIMAKFSKKQWNYEGIAYYVFSQNLSGLVPIYRFYSRNNNTHFYTQSLMEKEYIIKTYPFKEWAYEGIAWYVPTKK